jgi:hypothetical protein
MLNIFTNMQANISFERVWLFDLLLDLVDALLLGQRHKSFEKVLL